MTPPLTQPSVFFSPPCAICFERTACERDAKHGLVSLRCGHCFGARCVESWLLTRRAKCPVCDDDACVEDIRVLFALDCIGAEDEDEDDRKGAGDSIEVELRRARETMRALREELRVLRANGASREVLRELNRDGKRRVGAASTAVGAKKTKTKSVADYFGGGGAADARWTFEECKTMKGGVIQDGVILMDTALTRDGRAVLQVESFFDDLNGPMIVALCVSSAVFVVNAAGQLTAVVPIESCIHAASWSPNEANMLFVAVRNRIGMSSILEYDLNSTSYRKPRKSNDFPTDAVYHSVLYFPELRTFVVGTGLTHWTMTMASDVRPDVRPVYDEREETVCVEVPGYIMRPDVRPVYDEREETVCVEVPGYIMRAHPSSRRIVSASTCGVVMSPTGNGQKVRVKLTTFDLIEQWGRDGGSAQLMPKVSSSILMGEYEQSDLTTYYDFSTLMCMGVLPDRSEIVAVGVGTTVEIYDSSTLALIQKFDVGGLVFRVDISPDGSLLTACSLPIGHTKGDFETHTRCINSYKARRVVEARLTQVVILSSTGTGTSQFDMPGDATTDECARETRAHGTRRVNYSGGVQAVIATLENLISTLDGAASSACASAPCRPIVAPPSTPCDMRAHGRVDELALKRHRLRRAARERGERVSLTEMSLMDLAREAAATDARDVMSQSMIRGDRLLHSERTSNKRKAHTHALEEAPSPIAPVVPHVVAELRSRQERLTTAMKNLHLDLHNAACAKKNAFDECDNA